jgi:GntR family transcriptional repressor for pyruvate dehydrogenase complex
MGAEMFEDMQIIKKSLSDTIVEKLEQMILENSFQVGERLPSEEKLAESFGVSRTILREAVKTLKERGLVDVKVGDGIYVAKPKKRILSDMVNRLVRLSDISMEEVYDFRRVLEVASCGLAAQNATEEELAALDEIVTEMEKSISRKKRWVELELQFHLQIAQASHNKLFYYIISPLADLLVSAFTKGFSRNAPEGTLEGITGHRSIIQSIRKRDCESAEKAMLRHLDHSKRIVLGI